jgi:MutL protein
VVTTPAGRVVEHSGKDLRAVRLLVGSGGLLRHGGAELAARVLTGGLEGHGRGAWMTPESAGLAVDGSYVLAAAGLLADDHPAAAAALAGQVVLQAAGRLAGQAPGQMPGQISGQLGGQMPGQIAGQMAGGGADAPGRGRGAGVREMNGR